MKRNKEAGLNWVSWITLALFGAAFAGVFTFMIRQARNDIRARSPEAKTAFQENFPGLEAAAHLAPDGKMGVVERANREPCACRCGYTVASCLKLDSQCPLRPKNLARVAQFIQEARTGGR